jgi:hypothetical protein
LSGLGELTTAYQMSSFRGGKINKIFLKADVTSDSAPGTTLATSIPSRPKISIQCRPQGVKKKTAMYVNVTMSCVPATIVSVEWH